jgi:heme exporter protein C
MFRLPGFV